MMEMSEFDDYMPVPRRTLLLLTCLASFPNVFTIFLYIISEADYEDSSVYINISKCAKTLGMDRRTITRVINFLIENKMMIKGEDPFIYYINGNVYGDPNNSNFLEPLPDIIKDDKFYIRLSQPLEKRKHLK